MLQVSLPLNLLSEGIATRVPVRLASWTARALFLLIDQGMLDQASERRTCTLPLSCTGNVRSAAALHQPADHCQPLLSVRKLESSVRLAFRRSGDVACPTLTCNGGRMQTCWGWNQNRLAAAIKAAFKVRVERPRPWPAFQREPYPTDQIV